MAAMGVPRLCLPAAGYRVSQDLGRSLYRATVARKSLTLVREESRVVDLFDHGDYPSTEAA